MFFQKLHNICWFLLLNNFKFCCWKILQIKNNICKRSLNRIVFKIICQLSVVHLFFIVVSQTLAKVFTLKQNVIIFL
ncbi:unnamed protein product [Acanthoscelides obtectus]|uniref:Uncharacterized protein n=1 Tax=Acanthoscelides obtectus TaxID=200917 RepID=A0A9P0KIY4_ACAOB|nr:unnamed protein product [Acanthoscelides obtectus]CAK1646322.1 hypothetical protein AOBTE_LOCUS14584 [Acanthoscelides obtectus]